MKRSVTMVLLALGAGAASAAPKPGADVRARAAKDLVCPAGGIRIQVWENGDKVEAQGCGRSAAYEKGDAGALELAMVEREVTREMRTQAAVDLQCSGAVTMTRTAYPQSNSETAVAEGCGREASYEVKDGALALQSVTGAAPTDVVAKVAADLGCAAAGLKVELTKGEGGAVTAGAHDCHDDKFVRYRLQPFGRMTADSLSALAHHASADLGCPEDKLTVLQDERDPKLERPTVDGCGRRATFVKKGGSYELASGPVAIQEGAAPPLVVTEGTGEEQKQVREFKERAAKDLGCSDAAVDATLFRSALKQDSAGDNVRVVEAQGCGRHVKYERLPSGLVLTFLEKPVPEPWLAQVAHDLDCAADKVSVHLYTFPQKGGAATLGAQGCERQASYEVPEKGGGPHLLYETAKAPPELTARIARDLLCAEEGATVSMIRRSATGPWAVTGKSCHDGSIWMYQQEPFRRIGRAVNKENP